MINIHRLALTFVQIYKSENIFFILGLEIFKNFYFPLYLNVNVYFYYLRDVNVYF